MESEDDLIKNFLVMTETTNKEKAKEMLAKNKWDLSMAVNEFIAFKEVPTNSIPMSSNLLFLQGIDDESSGFLSAIAHIFTSPKKRGGDLFVNCIASKYQLQAKPALFTGEIKTLIESARKRKMPIIIVIINGKDKKAIVEKYLNETICNIEIVNIINGRFLIVGYDQEFENGKRCMKAVGAKKAPVLLITYPDIGGNVKELYRFEGSELTIKQLRTQLINVIDQKNNITNQIKADIINSPETYDAFDKQEVDKILREHQENEYSKAAQIDKQKMQSENKEQFNTQNAKKLHERQAQLEEELALLVPDENVIELTLRLPDGKKISQLFRKDHKISVSL